MQPNAHSTLMGEGTSRINSGTSKRAGKQHLPTTRKMLEEALLALNSQLGFTIYKLKKYICDKYQIELTTQRQNLIKNQLRAQLVSGTLTNLTGKGLNGHLRLRTNRKKTNNSTVAAVDAAFNAIKRKQVVGKSKSGAQYTTRTPPNMTAQLLIPRAPHRNSMAGYNHLEAGETPCSAGVRVGRKRKLLPPPEALVFSQEY